MSKWSIYDKQIIELLNQDVGFVDIAKDILNAPDASRRSNKDVESLSDYCRKHKRRLLELHEGFYNTAEEADVSHEIVDRYWDKTDPKKSILIVNPNRKKVDPEKEIDFLSIFKDKIQPVTVTHPQADFNGLFDRLVYSDTHIGMDPNKDGFALYDGVWDEAEIDRRLSIAVNWTLQHQKSDVLLIHDLGDFLDGFDGYTTRGGHKLPQNMDNQKAFDTGLKFKIKMIDSLIGNYKFIECVNITNDNHGGSFSYLVNSAFKAYIELKYANVKVTNQRKFIDHYVYDGATFLLTHGKDAQHMKFGFKPEIDAKQIKMISDYIDFHKLTGWIQFDKGDSHRELINKSLGKFQYWNHPAFSPPSDWVKTNFSNSMSGFMMLNYRKGLEPTINDYIF